MIVIGADSDVTPPAVNINSSDQGGSGLASSGYSLNEAAFQPYNSSFIINTPCNYTIKTQAKDSSGNTTITDVIAFSV